MIKTVLAFRAHKPNRQPQIIESRIGHSALKIAFHKMLDATEKCCWNSSFGLKGELLTGGNTYRTGNIKYGKSFKYLFVFQNDRH